MARGFGNEEKQNIKNVRVLRRLPDGAIQRIEVNIHDIIHRGQLNRDIELQAGDYVIVPRRSKRFTVLSGIRDLLQPVLQVGFLKQIF